MCALYIHQEFAEIACWRNSFKDPTMFPESEHKFLVPLLPLILTKTQTKIVRRQYFTASPTESNIINYLLFCPVHLYYVCTHKHENPQISCTVLYDIPRSCLSWHSFHESGKSVKNLLGWLTWSEFETRTIRDALERSHIN